MHNVLICNMLIFNNFNPGNFISVCIKTVDSVYQKPVIYITCFIQSPQFNLFVRSLLPDETVKISWIFSFRTFTFNFCSWYFWTTNLLEKCSVPKLSTPGSYLRKLTVSSIKLCSPNFRWTAKYLKEFAGKMVE